MICSHYRIILIGTTTTTLLDYGDQMVAEPDFGWGQEVQSVGFVRGSNKRHIGRGNRSREISFSKVLETAAAPLVSSLRAWQIESGAEIELAARCHLQISIADATHTTQHSYLILNTQVTSVDARMNDLAMPVRTYRASGGELIAGTLSDYQLRDHSGNLLTDHLGQPINSI